MVKSLQSLTEDAKRIREEVFVEEQGFQQEFDETDSDAHHLVWYEAGEAAATLLCWRQRGDLLAGAACREEEIPGQAYWRKDSFRRRGGDRKKGRNCGPPVFPSQSKGILCEMRISCHRRGIYG